MVTSFVLLSEKNQKKLKEKVKEYQKTTTAQK
jgi:hypothetical protein